MKHGCPEDEPLENLLRRAHLPVASARLEQRITTEARKVWNQTSGDIPWQIPLRRLAAAAAAAAFIVWLANLSSDYTLARWQPRGPSFGTQRPTDFAALPEMPYGPFARHMVLIDRRSPMIDASALSDYVENMRRILDQAQRSGVSTRPARPPGSSRLVPSHAGANSFS
jgi:hypothetical protein